MMDQPNRKSFWLPVVSALAGSAALSFALVKLNGFEFIHDMTRAHEHYQADEILVALVTTVIITMTVLAFVLWQRLRRTEQAYRKLSIAHERLRRSRNEADEQTDRP